MKIVTYNIHKGRGMDGRVSIKRISKVLAGIDADIVAMQEIYSAADGYRGQVERIAADLDMNIAFGRTRQQLERPYGNAILSRWPIRESFEVDISQGAREHRGCVRADLQTPGGILHVYNIHMHTSFFERRHQIRAFIASRELHDNLSGPRVLVGDFNEWVKGLTTRMLSERFESLNLRLHVHRRRSYPGILPLLHLDQFYFEEPLRIQHAQLVRTPLTMIASDHLPLVTTFMWGHDNVYTTLEAANATAVRLNETLVDDFSRGRLPT